MKKQKASIEFGIIGLDTFGKSAKASDVIKAMGFDFESVYSKIRKIVK